MKKIPLTQGKFALVDDGDFEELTRWKWWFDATNGYACRTVWKKSKVYMHRQVLDTPKGKYTDHINHNKLDNRKHNLRICSQSINMHNSRKLTGKYSTYKGVSWNKNRKRWFAQITCNYKHINLGYFNDEKTAHSAYVEAKTSLNLI